MYKQNHNKRTFWHRHRRMVVPLLIVLALLVVAFVAQLFFAPDDAANESTEGAREEQIAQDEPSDDEISSLSSVQAELDTVLESVRGSHSVVVQDAATGEILASHQPNEVFFASSIYKLYVAYLALEDFQAGLYEPDEPYNQGRSRMECVVVMLRDSDSPCPEQMWEEQGRDVGNERLDELGLGSTDLLAVTTTATDANALLLRLHDQQDLNDEYTQVMRDSLRDFPERDFRQGLPSAFDEYDEVVVYAKPGIYDEGWLDAAIIELPSGRSVIVSIFSDNAYYQEVRTIADAIISPLIEATR